MTGKSDQYFMADLYGELQLASEPRKRAWHAVLPGLVLVAVAALAALWLADQYGAPPVLLGLLLGFALNFTSADARLLPGLDFASQTLLRIGIVLLGLKVTWAEISALGLLPFLGLLAIMAAVILAGIAAARLARLDLHLGLLAGGATAICGISAALALWSIIGSRRVGQEGFAITVLGVTLASAAALATLPALATATGMTDAQAGFLVGASIHDVAQAIGAGFAVSGDAGEVATVVKLSRVTLLVPILLLVAFVLGRGGKGGGEGARFSFRQAVPWFIAGFVAVVIVNSVAELPPQLGQWGGEAAGFFLLLAVIAAAIKADLSGIVSYGWKAFLPVIASTLTAFVLAFGVAQLL